MKRSGKHKGVHTDRKRMRREILLSFIKGGQETRSISGLIEERPVIFSKEQAELSLS